MDKTLHTQALTESMENKLLAVASEELTDRDGDVVSIDGWDLKNYRKNPVLMWFHMMDGSNLPVGRAKGLEIKDFGGKRKLVFEPEFHEITEQAITIGRMYQEGFLKAFSVGFRPKDSEQISSDGEFPPRYKYLSQELIEISCVPIPSLPTAVIIDNAQKKGLNVPVVKSLLKEMQTKSVIPYKQTKVAPEDDEWNAPAELSKAEVKDLKIMCTWFDSENEDTTTSYKLAHHKVDDGHAVVWAGVREAMGALLSSTEGADIPDGDRKGVYDHLNKHYEEFGRTAPEFKAYRNIELLEFEVKGLILTSTEVFSIKKEDMKALIEKQGRVLSKSNENKIRTAVSSLSEVLSALEKEAGKEEEGEKGIDVLSRLEGQIKHLIGEVQAYRKESVRSKNNSMEAINDEDMKDALRIVVTAASVALKKAKEKTNSMGMGGDK